MIQLTTKTQVRAAISGGGRGGRAISGAAALRDPSHPALPETPPALLCAVPERVPACGAGAGAAGDPRVRGCGHGRPWPGSPSEAVPEGRGRWGLGQAAPITVSPVCGGAPAGARGSRQTWPGPVTASGDILCLAEQRLVLTEQTLLS